MTRALHAVLPAWGTDSILHTTGVNTSAPREQAGLCVKPKDVLLYKTPTFALTQREKTPQVCLGEQPFCHTGRKRPLHPRTVPHSQPFRCVRPAPAPQGASAAPPCPTGSLLRAGITPVSGRGDVAAGVGLWGAEPMGCPPLALPTFPSEESTSARLQRSGLRPFIWQELTEGSSLPRTDTQHERQQRCVQAQVGPSGSTSATSLLQNQTPLTATCKSDSGMKGVRTPQKQLSPGGPEKLHCGALQRLLPNAVIRTPLPRKGHRSDEMP